MKYLIMSDCHGKVEKVEEILGEAESLRADILYAGDFGSELGKNLKLFSDINRDIYLVPGSHDLRSDYRKLKELEAEYNHIHCMYKSRAGDVIGYGGSSAMPEKAFGLKRSLAANFYFIDEIDLVELNDLFLESKADIFLTHEPPLNYCDLACFKIGEKYTISARPDDPSAVKRHIGDLATALAVEEFMPKLTACGHVHEINFGYDLIGQLIMPEFAGALDLNRRVLDPGDKVDHAIINPGPAYAGLYSLVDVGKKVKYHGHFRIL